jgi:hypothetical protein
MYIFTVSNPFKLKCFQVSENGSVYKRRGVFLRNLIPLLSSLFLVGLLTTSRNVYAQKKFFKSLATKQDTSYVVDYSKMITARLFASKKYSNFTIHDTQSHTLRYRPNDRLNFGIGFNYSVIGLNVGINFPFINNDDGKYGKSRYLDLQSHIYIPKLAIDLIGQFYKGFYLSNSRILLDQPLKTYYIRPDIETRSLGFSALYIFNDKKFSYRSFFLQNEWQKKSAGSLLLGGSILGVATEGDSSLFPKRLEYNVSIPQKNFNSISNWMIAVNAGYAYTFVLKSNWFFSASATAGTGYGSSKVANDETDEVYKKFVFNSYGTARFGIGYNSEKLFIGPTFVHYFYFTPTAFEKAGYAFNTGNFRLNLAYRFNAKFLKKKIKEIDPHYQILPKVD